MHAESVLSMVGLGRVVWIVRYLSYSASVEHKVTQIRYRGLVSRTPLDDLGGLLHSISTLVFLEKWGLDLNANICKVRRYSVHHRDLSIWRATPKPKWDSEQP